MGFGISVIRCLPTKHSLSRLAKVTILCGNDGPDLRGPWGRLDGDRGRALLERRAAPILLDLGKDNPRFRLTGLYVRIRHANTANSPARTCRQLLWLLLATLAS
jgi:hypothetical protein